MDDVHGGRGPPQQAGDLSSRAAEGRPDQHALDPLEFGPSLGFLQPLGQGVDRVPVEGDEGLHPSSLGSGISIGSNLLNAT